MPTKSVQSIITDLGIGLGYAFIEEWILISLASFKRPMALNFVLLSSLYLVVPACLAYWRHSRGGNFWCVAIGYIVTLFTLLRDFQGAMMKILADYMAKPEGARYLMYLVLAIGCGVALAVFSRHGRSKDRSSAQ